MANPTAQEQELLELINRMRLHPEAELPILLDAADPNHKSYDPAIKNALDYFKVNRDTLKAQWNKLIAVAPVAWSSELNVAAAGHNRAMIDGLQQAHQVDAKYDGAGNLIKAQELNLPARLNAVNYQYTLADENIYAYGQSVLHTHAGYAIDWGSNSNGAIDGIQNPAGHRDAILSDKVREVGIAITPENDPNTQIGSLVSTQNFGNRSALNGKAWLLGVAFQDLNKDTWYEAGEGLKDVQVKITGIDGTKFSDTVNVADAGGYQELLDPGKYRVDFIRGGNIVGTQTTSIDRTAPSNVKLDLVIPVMMLDNNLPTTPTTQPNPTVNPATTITQTIENPVQITAPINMNLKTTSSASNLLDFRTDDATTGTAQDLTNKTIAINFTGVNADAAYHNYGGFYRIEDTQGTVIDIDGKSYLPQDNGYTRAALRRSQSATDGIQLDKNGLNGNTNLKGGYLYAPFLVANGSVNDVLNSQISAAPRVYFDYIAANTDGVQHTKFLGANKFGFEDLFGGGDRDYNDLIFQVNAKVA